MRFDDILMTCVRKDIDADKVPMLIGEPGIGKSSWIENLARIMNTKAFTLACNQLATKEDLTGARLVPVEGTSDYQQRFYPHQDILQAIRYANEHQRETPILFLDELNRTSPDVTSALLSLSTARRIGSYELPKNLRIVTAGNDKGNVTPLDEASISRFALYKVTPDTPTYLSLDQNLNPFVRNVLEAHPEVLFCKPIDKEQADQDEYIDDVIVDDNGMAQFTTPRTVTYASDWLNRFTNDEIKMLAATNNVVDGEEMSALQEALEAHVGHTQFVLLLVNEIQTNITRVSNTSATLLIEKPAAYDQLKACPTVNDLQSFAMNVLDDKERAACLVYAIYEKADNDSLIHILAPTVNAMPQEISQTLLKLHWNDQLDADNLAAFYNSGAQIADTLAFFMNQQ